MQPMDLTAYRDLWKTHGVMALLASALVARMPVMATMVPLAFLAKDAAGNFGWAGVVAGAYSVGMAVASVVWSRLADRRGARRVLIGTGMTWGASMAVVALLPYSWYRVLPVAAARGRHLRCAGHLGPAGQLAAAGAWCAAACDLSLDATAQELLFVIGPMLGALVVSFASPRAAAGVRGDGRRGHLVVRPEAAAAGRCTRRDAARPTVRQLLLHPHRPRCWSPCSAWHGLRGDVARHRRVRRRARQPVDRRCAGDGGRDRQLTGGLVGGALPGRRDSYAWRRMLA